MSISIHIQSVGNRRRILSALVITCLFALATAAAPSFADARQQLPDAEEILDKSTEASGGKEAYDKIKNRVTHGTMEIVGQGLTFSLSIYSAKPNLAYTILESEATGKLEGGTDGKVVWENSLIQGPAIKKGVERTNALRDSAFDRLAYWREFFEEAECVGKQAIDDKTSFKIILTPKPLLESDQQEAEPLVIFIDESTSLVTKIESNVVAAAGTIPVEAFLSDYKEVDGILLPHKLVTKLLTQERVTTLKSIEHNVELPADRFALPAEIQSLIDGN